MDDTMFGFEIYCRRHSFVLLRKHRDKYDIRGIGYLLIGAGYRYPLRKLRPKRLRLPAVFMYRKDDLPSKFRRGAKSAHDKRGYAAGTDKSKCQSFRHEVHHPLFKIGN